MHPLPPHRTAPKFFLCDTSSESEPESDAALPPVKAQHLPSAAPRLTIRNPDIKPLTALHIERPIVRLPRPARPVRVSPSPSPKPLRQHPLLQGLAPNAALVQALGQYQARGRPFFFFTDTESGKVMCANTALIDHRSHSWNMLSYPKDVLAPLSTRISYVQPDTSATIHLGFVSKLMMQSDSAAILPCLTAIPHLRLAHHDEQALLAVAVAAACFELGLVVDKSLTTAVALWAAVPPPRRSEAYDLALQFAVMHRQTQLVHHFFDRGASPRFISDDNHTSALAQALRPGFVRYLPLLLQALVSADDLAWVAGHLDHNGVHRGTQAYDLLRDHIALTARKNRAG